MHVNDGRVRAAVPLTQLIRTRQAASPFVQSSPLPRNPLNDLFLSHAPRLHLRTSRVRHRLIKAWKQDGWGGLFKGNTANCLKVAPSRGTQFLVYEFAKRQMRAAGFGLAAAGGLNAGARLCAGGFAGMVAAIIVYPLEVSPRALASALPTLKGGGWRWWRGGPRERRVARHALVTLPTL